MPLQIVTYTAAAEADVTDIAILTAREIVDGGGLSQRLQFAHRLIKRLSHRRTDCKIWNSTGVRRTVCVYSESRTNTAISHPRIHHHVRYSR